MRSILLTLSLILTVTHALRIPITKLKSSNSLTKSIKLQAQSDEALSINWDFCDGVYLITTTQTNNNRLEKTKQELESVNLWDKVKVRTFKPDDEDRVRGCYTSHISVLQEIQKEFKNKPNYKVLVLEDNLEKTLQIDPKTVESVSEFLSQPNTPWDVFHLAYMMYVPGLQVTKLSRTDYNQGSWSENIVKLRSDAGSSIGTSAYLISKSGVDTMLEQHKRNGYIEAIPNIMAANFPESRFAAYPMIFHRAAKIGSLVNPQLDSFRKVMFSPVMYSTWESLMVTTGLMTNKLFPTLLVTLLITVLTALYGIVTNSMNNSADSATTLETYLPLLVAVAPLGIGLWGASLFKPGNTGAGFAATAQKK